MSFYASDADDTSIHGRRGHHLRVGSFSRLGLGGRHSVSRRSPVDPNADDDNNVHVVVNADDDESVLSSDDESVMFSNEPEDAEEDEILFDDSTIQNTRANAQMLYGAPSQYHITNYEDEDLLDPAADEFQTAPNIVYARSEKELMEQRTLLIKNGLPATQPGRPPLVTHGPVLEPHQCTVRMTYGDYEGCARQSKRPKRYIVASDSSEGSQYAINWATGTVLRDGDEMLVVSVMDADAKGEQYTEDTAPPNLAPPSRALQDMAIFLCHQVFVLLQRTQLGVRIACQAVHSTNARHMLLDIADFYSPTMVIVGSRGVDGIRGMLGSMSHYLVQKCSVPVMVCHNKLQLPRLPRGKADVVNNVRKRHMRLDQAAVEKLSSRQEPQDEEEEGEHVQADREQREQRDSERMERLNRESLARRSTLSE